MMGLHKRTEMLGLMEQGLARGGGWSPGACPARGEVGGRRFQARAFALATDHFVAVGLGSWRFVLRVAEVSTNKQETGGGGVSRHVPKKQMPRGVCDVCVNQKKRKST